MTAAKRCRSAGRWLRDEALGKAHDAISSNAFWLLWLQGPRARHTLLHAGTALACERPAMPLTVNRRTLAALGLGWAVAARTGAAPALPTELRFAYMDKTPAVTEKAIAVLTSAYARLGIAVTFVPLPFARSLMEANAGIYDGEAARLAGVA